MPILTCPHCRNPVTLPDPWPDPGFVCPHCHNASALPSAAAPPAALPLPPPEPSFHQTDPHAEVSDDNEFHGSAARGGRARHASNESSGKALIFFGYAAFVVIPIGIVVALAYYKLNQKTDDPTPEVAQKEKEKEKEKKPDADQSKKVTPKPPIRTAKEPKVEPEPDPKPEPKPELKPEPEPDPKPPVKPVAVAVIPTAPEPRAVPEIVPIPIAIAPEPRVVNTAFLPPEGSFKAERWEKLGEVEVRVAGVDMRRVPLRDVNQLPRMSATPVLTIWIEVRTTNATRKITLTRWQDPLGESCTLTTNALVPVDRAILPAGCALDTGLEPRQMVVANAAPRVQVVVFNEPPDGANSVRLTLKGDAVGEPEKEVKVSIPRDAWEKKK